MLGKGRQAGKKIMQKELKSRNASHDSLQWGTLGKTFDGAHCTEGSAVCKAFLGFKSSNISGLWPVVCQPHMRQDEALNDKVI